MSGTGAWETEARREWALVSLSIQQGEVSLAAERLGDVLAEVGPCRCPPAGPHGFVKSRWGGGWGGAGCNSAEGGASLSFFIHLCSLFCQ
jgi:hypothetical protein